MSIVNVKLEVHDSIPEESFSLFGVKNGDVEALVHEALCRAIHEDDADAHNFLTSYITDVNNTDQGDNNESLPV